MACGGCCIGAARNGATAATQVAPSVVSLSTGAPVSSCGCGKKRDWLDWLVLGLVILAAVNAHKR